MLSSSKLPRKAKKRSKNKSTGAQKQKRHKVAHLVAEEEQDNVDDGGNFKSCLKPLKFLIGTKECK